MTIKNVTMTLESDMRLNASKRLHHITAFGIAKNIQVPVLEATERLMHRLQASTRAMLTTVAALNSVQ